jgi:hypothetical protein
LLASGSGTLWRAVAGVCGGAAPVIERSNDAGQTWTDVTPRYLGIARVGSLDGLAVDAVEGVMGIGSGCGPQAMRSFTNGEFWEPYADVLAISRYVDLADSAIIHTVSGVVAAPCALAHSLRARRETITLVCDQIAYVWRDGGWAALPGTDAVAVAIAGADVISAQIAAGCDGLTLTRFAGGDPAAGTPVGCAAVTDAEASAAIVAFGEGILVWSGDRIVVVE